MASASAATPGRLLAGKYRIEAPLAEGGMGAVYRAMNETCSRPVAIKILRPEFGNDEQFVKRFMREGRAANLVKHPNIVDVIDIDRDEGDLFIVQDLLVGEDLGTLLKRSEKGMRVKDALAVVVPVAEALGAAHEHGLVHRDLKPANVFLAQVEGKIVPKVLDFGVAKLADLDGDTRLTPTFAALGTPAYMSPEQITEPLTVAAPSDVWALGIMLHRMVTGKLPFQSESQGGMLVAICTKPPTLLIDEIADAPPSLEKVVRKCLMREVEHRYASCTEAALALREVHAEIARGVKRAPKRRLSGAATLIGGSLPPSSETSEPPPQSLPQPDLELDAAAPADGGDWELASPEAGWSDLAKSASPPSSGPRGAAPRTSGPPMASRPPSGAPQRSGRPASNDLLAELMSDEPDARAHAATHIADRGQPVALDLEEPAQAMPRSPGSMRPVRAPMSPATSMRSLGPHADSAGPLTSTELTNMGLAGLIVGMVVSAGSALQQADAIARLDAKMGWPGVSVVTLLLGYAALRTYKHATEHGWLTLLVAAAGLAAMSLCGLGTALAVADGMAFFSTIQQIGPWVAAGTVGSFAAFGAARAIDDLERKNLAYPLIGLSVLAALLALRLVVASV
jgi:serine/threonine protein kinase